MNDYERRETDPGLETGPEEVEIYDRPETAVTGGGTDTGLWVGLLVLIVAAVLVVLLLLFLF